MLHQAVAATTALAALALYVASRRAPSLTTPGRVVALALPLSELIGAWGRSDGRTLYHASQAGQCAWLAAVVLVAGARPRVALGVAVACLGACVGWWPAPARGLYAVLQAGSVVVAAVHVGPRLRAARWPTPGLLAALVLVTSEALVLVTPYALALQLDRPVAELWDAALVLRLVEWTTLFVIGLRACWPLLCSLLWGPYSSRSYGPGFTRVRRIGLWLRSRRGE